MTILAERPTFLYRAIAPTGQIVYLGIADDWERRLREHRKAAPWYRYAHHLEIDVFEDRSTAYAAESWAIRYEHPAWNTDDQTKACPFIPPVPIQRFSRRLYGQKWARYNS